MKRTDLIRKALCGLLGAALFLSGCAARPNQQAFTNALQPVSAITLPPEVRIVGMGEATHGNKEFVQLKLEVFRELVQKYGYLTFALEGDFGGCQAVNDYILNGKGSAVEAVTQIGFAIYKTREMADLVEWMRQYNQAAPADKRIHFYGFDMQRYDRNKDGLFAYLQKVDPGKVEVYRARLADLNDATVFDQSKEKVQAGLSAGELILADLQQNKSAYLAAASAEEFEMALQYATSIRENAVLRGTDVNYSNTRDQFMAQKVQWIAGYEQKMGREKLFIAGHNGHIEKSSASPLYRSMGDILQETYADRYFAIGTEFYQSTFNCKDGTSGERKVFDVKNNGTSVLIDAFRGSGSAVAYLDIRQAMQADPSVEKMLTTKLRMSNIGDEFNSLYRFSKAFSTLQMAPAEAYDAILFVREATPTTLLR